MPESNDTRCTHIHDEITGVSSSVAYDSLPTLESDELRKTLESVGDGFFACDGDWRFIYMNSAAEDFIGVSRSAVIGKNHWECFPQMVGTQLEKEYRLAAAGQVRHFEFFSPRCGRWFENRCFPREGGGISVVFRDISERKRAEEAIAQREAVLEAFFSTSQGILNIEDEEFRYLRTDSLTPTYFGLDRQSIIGKSIAELSPEFMRDFGPMMRHVIETGQPQINQEVHAPVPAASGEIGYWRASYFPVPLPEGKRGIGVVGLDITEIKKAELALQESEARFRSLFEHSLDAMFLTFADGRIIAANPAARAMFGMTEEEICRVGRAGLMDSEDQRLGPALEERFRTSRARAELRCVRKDGTKLDVEASSVILDGKPARAFVVMHDITQRKRTQELLIRSEKVAALGRMAANLAHEINNPLSAVMNTLFLAQSAPECPASVRQYLEIADQELRRISHITRQALGFYREDSTPTTVTLSTIVDEAIDLFKTRIKAKDATIKKQYTDAITVTAVAGELRQVFSNLISNSLDAIDEKGTVLVQLSSARSKVGQNQARISIADNGRGIQPDLRTRIFEPLFTTKGEVGTGLGLWVSKQLIEKNGGSIRVHSSVNGSRRGTTFRIVLPATAAAQNQRAG